MNFHSIYNRLYEPPVEFEKRRDLEPMDLPMGAGALRLPLASLDRIEETPTTLPQPIPSDVSQIPLPQAEGGGGAGQEEQPHRVYSPELEGLKHRYLSHDWFAGSPYAQYLVPAMQGLFHPVQMDVGLTPQERQDILNQARMNISGQTLAGIRELERALGGRGFGFGESGLADTALAQLLRGGQQQFAQLAQNLATQEAQNRFAQRLALEQLNLDRILGGGKFADLLEQTGLGRMGLGLQALASIGGLEQFIEELRQRALDRAAIAGRHADEMELARQRFEYQQQMDALDLLAKLYGSALGQQEARYSPYWDAVQRSYMFGL